MQGPIIATMKRPTAMSLIAPRVATPAPRRRPSGSIDPASVGLILRDLPAGATVLVGPTAVVPDADGFVPVLTTARTILAVRTGIDVMSAPLKLSVAPPRVLSVRDLPVTQRLGDSVTPSGDARVELVAFADGAQVLVDGRAPTSAVRDPASGIVSVRVPSGRHVLRVTQPAGAPRQGEPLDITVNLEPGEMIDVWPDDLGAPVRTMPPVDGFGTGGTYDISGDAVDGPGYVSPSPTPTSTSSPSPTPTSTSMQTTPSPTPRPRGALTITVNAASPLVTINGVRVDGPPYRRDLPPGDYELSVSADGFEPVTSTVTIEAGMITPADVQLVPAKTSPGRGVWVAAGIGVTALAVIAALLLSGGEREAQVSRTS